MHTNCISDLSEIKISNNLQQRLQKFVLPSNTVYLPPGVLKRTDISRYRSDNMDFFMISLKVLIHFKWYYIQYNIAPLTSFCGELLKTLQLFCSRTNQSIYGGCSCINVCDIAYMSMMLQFSDI